MAKTTSTKPSVSKAEKSKLKTPKTKKTDAPKTDAPKKPEKTLAKKKILPVKENAEISAKKTDTVDVVVEKKIATEDLTPTRPVSSDTPKLPEPKTLNIVKNAKITKDDGKYDYARLFTLYPKASFLKGILQNGDDKQTAEIKRTAPSNYLVIGGFMPDGKTKHTLEFPCVSLEEADLLWSELIQYEADIKSGKIKHTVVAPDAKIATPAHKPTHNVTANDHEAIIIAKMETDGNIIANSLCGSFQFKHHGTNKQADVQNLLNRQPKTYQYDIKSDGKGKFIEIKNGAIVVRVPKDETQYLPIS